MKQRQNCQLHKITKRKNWIFNFDTFNTLFLRYSVTYFFFYYLKNYAIFFHIYQKFNIYCFNSFINMFVMIAILKIVETYLITYWLHLRYSINVFVTFHDNTLYAITYLICILNILISLFCCLCFWWFEKIWVQFLQF